LGLKYFHIVLSVRIDGKTSKPEQTFNEPEVCVKETSSVAKVNQLYQKLITEDLTSVGECLQISIEIRSILCLSLL